MATVRIRGIWQLSVYAHRTEPTVTRRQVGTATLEVKTATRAKVTGQITFGGKQVLVEGRVVPGSPAIVTLREVGKGGQSVEGGLDAVLYIPPWWPTVDYSYDLIIGTMSVGTASALGVRKLESTLLEVSGIQPFE